MVISNQNISDENSEWDTPLLFDPPTQRHVIPPPHL